MNTLMPGRLANFGRNSWMTPLTSSLRFDARGSRWKNIRPIILPANAGRARAADAGKERLDVRIVLDDVRHLLLALDHLMRNEVPCGVSVTTKTWLLSSSGMNPLGIFTNSDPVSNGCRG